MRHVLRVLIGFGAAVLWAGCVHQGSQSQSLTPSSPANEGDVQLPKIFGDNMVLQQGMAVPVWGWGTDGTVVTIHYGNETATAVVRDGKWMAYLPHLHPGRPQTLTVKAANTLEFTNVAVGEVWVAGGQSNMEFPLAESANGREALESADQPEIRLIKAPHTRDDAPATDINASWKECSAATVSHLSAVAYYFARSLHTNLNVPIGIVESDWGGTPAEAWMSSGALHTNRDYQVELLARYSLAQSRYRAQSAAYLAAKQAAKDDTTPFHRRTPARPWKPSELYNGMIAPIAPFAIRGVIWYQGESNTDTRRRAEMYRELFADLIRDWRAAWHEGNFPFLLVQLAPYKSIQAQPSESSWAVLREAQLEATKSLPNVAMAVITDVGEQHDIHPKHKEPVGERLALAARALAYHQALEYSGPVYKNMKIQNGAILLTFDHVDGGLQMRGGELTGFAIAGQDRKFVWATAKIRGPNTVAVYNSSVPEPVAVRYGWADYPLVNLWNKSGLPASPFRTDDFLDSSPTAK